MFCGDINADCSSLYEILSNINLKSGTQRKQMCKEGASVLYGTTWRGFLKYDKEGNKVMRKKLPTGRYETTLKTEYPELMGVFEDFRDLYFKDFQFNNIMINKNYPVGLHKDKANVGDSVLISFGDYEGGKTRVHYGGVEGHKIIKDYDSWCNPVTFNGSLYAHEVLPYTGERYALVFFYVD